MTKLLCMFWLVLNRSELWVIVNDVPVSWEATFEQKKSKFKMLSNDSSSFKKGGFQCHVTNSLCKGWKAQLAGRLTRRLFTPAWLAGRGIELGTSGVWVSTLNRLAMLPSLYAECGIQLTHYFFFRFRFLTQAKCYTYMRAQLELAYVFLEW